MYTPVKPNQNEYTIDFRWSYFHLAASRGDWRSWVKASGAEPFSSSLVRLDCWRSWKQPAARKKMDNDGICSGIIQYVNKFRLNFVG